MVDKIQYIKFGKKPARPGAIKFKFSTYFNKATLPMPTGAFGHESLVNNWGMLANDRFGCCVWAGAAHEEMMESLEGGHTTIPFTDESVLSDYAAATGFNPNDPGTDQGTDMAQAASYRRKTGILDANGNRHKVDAYVGITPGDVTELMQATYLFGSVGIGINVPDFAMSQFNSGQPWHLPSNWQNASIEGGHYIPVVGRNSKGYILVVTWGKLHAMSDAFYQAYNDEAIAYVNLETLNEKGLTPEGLNKAQLEADLAALTKDPRVSVS